MITVRLLGGAKKALGKSSTVILQPRLSISQVISLLRNEVTDASLLNRINLLVAVNGVESSSLDGDDTIVRSGDVVTIVSVVHGGAH
jgi:molybdopterin converting factor small subunit